MLEAKNLTVDYGQVRALFGVDLKVESGTRLRSSNQ